MIDVLDDRCINALFQHLEDLKKDSNKRIYIGPGRDGSSDDKIAVDCKFNPQNTKITFSKSWERAGYKKTTFAYSLGKDSWDLIEHNEALGGVTKIASEDQVKKIAIFIYPILMKRIVNG